MIISMLLSVYIAFMQAWFSVFPGFAMPNELQAPLDYIITVVNTVIPVLHMVFGYAFFTATVTSIFVLWQLENIYKLVMWLIRKIPLANIT